MRWLRGRATSVSPKRRPRVELARCELRSIHAPLLFADKGVRQVNGAVQVISRAELGHLGI